VKGPAVLDTNVASYVYSRKRKRLCTGTTSLAAGSISRSKRSPRSGLQDKEGDGYDIVNAVRALKGKPPLKPLRFRSR